ncbi:ankyrin repeat and LEM domain-containing protein 1 homolog [Planococcus citri]|uniref:ankyrin repeat and LEM domain-containing protein 1 homolog n=1 Tax=Planococcus citri TaxID=170843 RepID=UPI0031F8CD9E
MGSLPKHLDRLDDLLEQSKNYKTNPRKHPQEIEAKLHCSNQKEKPKTNKYTQRRDGKYSMSGDSSLQSNRKTELSKPPLESKKCIEKLDVNSRSPSKSNRKPELVKPSLESKTGTENIFIKNKTARQSDVHSTSSRSQKPNKKTELVKLSLESTTEDSETENLITKKNTARQNSAHSTSSRLPKSNRKTEFVKPSLESTTDSETGNSITKKNTPKLNSEQSTPSHSLNSIEKSRYSDPLLLSIKTWIETLDDYKNTISRVFRKDFYQLDSSEPNKGSCFNYFLLDPRITNNFPQRNKNHSLEISWKTFLSGIFYIGKGTSDRPYHHLKTALKERRSNDPSKKHGKKIQTILDIWNEGKGVVILLVFERKVDLESFTREAAMIEVIGTRNLGNKINGTYYGQISTWKSEEKRELGRYLLYESYQTYLSKPAPEIFPYDL